MKKVPSKNYIIVSILCVTTIVIVGYFTFWYKATKDYSANNSIFSGYLLEIGEDEVINNLSNYVLDNPNTILYMSYGNDSTIKEFESGFKQFIKEENIKAEFVYIDLNRIEDKNFTEEFKENFLSDELKNKNFSIIRQPNLYVFKEGKIVTALYYKEQNIDLNDVKRYLKSEEVVGND